MGYIFAFILIFFLVIVGFDNLLIALGVGGAIGLIVGIVQAVQEKKGKQPRKNKSHSTQEKKQSYWDDEDQVVNDMILMDMMKKDKKKKPKKDYTEYWETHCESCGELLEDCECDWKKQSKQDISQDMDDLEFDEMNDIWDEMDDDDGLF